MQTQSCLFCGNIVQLIHVHGHYQCPVCKTNALPCCDGDNCETNALLRPSVNDTFDNENANLKQLTSNLKRSQ